MAWRQGQRAFSPSGRDTGLGAHLGSPDSFRTPSSPRRQASTCRQVPHSITHPPRPQREARRCWVWVLLAYSLSCSRLMNQCFPCLPPGRQGLPPGGRPGGPPEAPRLHRQALFPEDTAHPAASQVTAEDPAPSPAVPQFPDTWYFPSKENWHLLQGAAPLGNLRKSKAPLPLP